MLKDRYQYLCHQVEAGRDAFVSHPITGEEGRVIDCILPTGHMVVAIPGHHKRCWDYRECDDLHHPKAGPAV